MIQFDEVLSTLFPEWSDELRAKAFSTGRALAPAQKFIGIAVLLRAAPEAFDRFAPKAQEAFDAIISAPA
jgi:hypothetical protein